MYQSTRSRHALKQLGSGGSAQLFTAVPRAARRCPAPPQLSREAKKRLTWFDYARTHSRVPACGWQTCRHFGIARSLYYYWKARYDPHRLVTLERRSSRPRRVRQRQWTAAHVEAVQQAPGTRLRVQHPRWGKQKLAIVLARQQRRLSASTIGRILTDLCRRRLLREPRRIRNSTHARHLRPHAGYPRAGAKPKGVTLSQAVPGALVQFDTMRLYPAPGVVRYHFTATDVCAQRAPGYSVVSVRGAATAGTATDFLREVQQRLPFPLAAIQIDGGSEFMASFEQACHDDQVPLWVLPPRSPKLNGHVERSNRTHREEFWECYDGDLDLPTLSGALQAWEGVYNTVRPHHALGLRPLAGFLATHHLS